jgi:hypothetical protein
MKRTQPRAWIVHQAHNMPPLSRPTRIEAADERAAEVLFPDHKARDFRRSAVVEADSPLPTAMTEDASDADGEFSDICHISHYDPQRVVIAAELETPGLVILSDAWFPGWRATVTTGQETYDAPIYRTNRVLRGVWLPAGRHTVEFRFLPASFTRGALISCVALLILAVTIGLDYRRRAYRGV